MTAADLLAPRDRTAASRTALIISVVGTAMTAGWETLALLSGRPPSTPVSALLTTAAFAALVPIAVAARRAPHRMPVLVYPGGAVVGIVLVAGAALFTRDATAAGQFGFVYLVVYASAHFRRGFAWFVTALAIVGDAVVVFTLLEPAAAMADLLVVGSALAMLTIVLLTGSAYQDRLMARLHDIAGTDSLTGLWTRGRLEDLAHHRLLGRRAPTTERDAPAVGLVVVDLDRFKLLNDTHGHPVGDAALAHLARLTRAHFRKEDAIARLGGDELAVLITSAPADIQERAEALRAAVRSTPLPSPSGPVEMSVSVGVAHGVPGEIDFAQLYAAADAALYRAKQAGRDGVAVVAV